MIYANWLVTLATIGTSSLIHECQASNTHINHHTQTKQHPNEQNKDSIIIKHQQQQQQRNLGVILLPAKTCLTESQCNLQRQKMNIDDTFYYVNTFPSIYGCFLKNGRAYWGVGGTDEQKAKFPLSGAKERIWCDDDTDDNDTATGWDGDGHGEDGWKGDGHKRNVTPSPTDSPTKSPSWKDDGWNTDGHDDDDDDTICVNRHACNHQRKRMGFTYFEVGTYDDTYGCFSKDGKAYWGKNGSEDEMAKRSLSGNKARIYCDSIANDEWMEDGYLDEDDSTWNEWKEDGHNNDGNTADDKWNDDGHKPDDEWKGDGNNNKQDEWTGDEHKTDDDKWSGDEYDDDDNWWDEEDWKDDGWDTDGWEGDDGPKDEWKDDGHDDNWEDDGHKTDNDNNNWDNDGWKADGHHPKNKPGWNSDGWDNDGHYKADIENVRKEVTDLIKGERDLIPKFMRLAFHDCLGGCDGCIDLDNIENRGLEKPINAIYPIVDKYKDSYSRADIWALATLVSADLAVMDDDRPEGLRFPMRYIGRDDCTDADARGVGGPDVTQPSTSFTTHELLNFFKVNFDFSTKETVTIMGVHAVAVATRGNAGFGNIGKKDGWVYNAADYVLNNRYYGMLAGDNYGWQMEYVVNGNGIPSRYQWYLEEKGKMDERPIMTNADMALVRDLSDHMSVDENGNHGKVDCVYKDDDGNKQHDGARNMRARSLSQNKPAVCPIASQTLELMIEYQMDNEMFLYDFEKVLEKMLKNGY